MCLCARAVSPNCGGNKSFTIFGHMLFQQPAPLELFPPVIRIFTPEAHPAFLLSATPGAPELSSSGDLHRRVGALLCYVSMDREIQIWSPRELCIWQGVRAEDWEAQIGEHTFVAYEMEQMLIMDPFQQRAQVCPSEGWRPAGERSRFGRPPSQRPT